MLKVKTTENTLASIEEVYTKTAEGKLVQAAEIYVKTSDNTLGLIYSGKIPPPQELFVEWAYYEDFDEAYFVANATPNKEGDRVQYACEYTHLEGYSDSIDWEDEFEHSFDTYQYNVDGDTGITNLTIYARSVRGEKVSEPISWHEYWGP